MNDIDRIKRIIPLWYATRKWAVEIVRLAFGLDDAKAILSSENRKLKAIPGTNWQIRVHGIGIDIHKTEDVGGIDFDFDKPDPDEWRLGIFFRRQYNDGIVHQDEYRDLFEDEDRLKRAIVGALADGTNLQTTNRRMQ